ncbi:MAG: aminotransferase class III-fold pyridoxal phosphate-dependent enzyme, partial [Actinomycetota bacterium]
MRFAIDNPIDGPRGLELWARADEVLPGGGIYRSRSADLAGRGVLPGFIAAAEGCRVTDVDGRTYIDYLAANGPNLLGYRHPEVEAAVEAERQRITTASLYPPALVEVVERLVDRFPSMAWGVVAKNGSEAVALGVRVARQYTGRARLLTFARAYHGNDDELATAPPAGPLTTLTERVERLAWNDAEAVDRAVDQHGHDVAAILLNPLDQNPGRPTTGASPEFVAAIARARDRHEIPIVVDDVRHGFRLHPDGSHRLLGLEPDLVVFGKALGNGHAISALLGRDDLRRAARKIFFTSTYMFEAPPMRAAIATLDAYDRDRAFDHLEAMGRRLRTGIEQAAADTGHAISYSGPVTMPTLLFVDDADGSTGRHFARQAA